ncbi:TetR/AcrR family transcriptional regulator [Brevibacterium sp. CCUG 69071]|nr:TetR/AcrR family transcriptional regulator [Brevibacterium sp. CCUG 69071]
MGRDALLRESLSALAADPRAPMLELAKTLDVGRTTLYRHFGDRDALVAEVARLGARMFVEAFLSARPEEGPGLAAVERVCDRLFTVPEALTLLFADNPIITDDVFAEVERERRDTEVAGSGGSASAGPKSAGESDDPLEWVIARGQADGSITAEVPVEWAAAYVFLTIGSGHLYSIAVEAADPSARARGLELTIRAVRRTLGAGSDI